MAAVASTSGDVPESHAEFEELGGVVPTLLEDLVELVEPPAALKRPDHGRRAADLAARATGAGATTPRR